MNRPVGCFGGHPRALKTGQRTDKLEGTRRKKKTCGVRIFDEESNEMKGGGRGREKAGVWKMRRLTRSFEKKKIKNTTT